MLLAFFYLENFRRKSQWKLGEGQKPQTSRGQKSPFRNCLWDLFGKLGEGNVDAVWVWWRRACWPEWHPGLSGCGIFEPRLFCWAGALSCVALPSCRHTAYSSGLFSLYFWKGPCPSFPPTVTLPSPPAHSKGIWCQELYLQGLIPEV